MTDRSSHSLFQGKYLGRTGIDGRCSKTLLPWIIEEFLLSEVEYKSIWFSPGDDEISFVEDDGTEFMSHAYSAITHFTVVKDEKSFGYLVRSSETKFTFYAYQALHKADVSHDINVSPCIITSSRSLGLRKALKLLLSMATKD